MSPRQSLEEKLQALNELTLGSDPTRDREVLAAALDDRHSRVVAKAAELATERLLYDLAPVLVDAYRRFLVDPVKRDPHCMAKQAIARALVALEFSRVRRWTATDFRRRFIQLMGVHDVHYNVKRHLRPARDRAPEFRAQRSESEPRTPCDAVVRTPWTCVRRGHPRDFRL